MEKTASEKGRLLKNVLFTILYDNTHQAAFAVVYDLLHGILEFYLAFFTDHGQFVFDSVFYQLLDGFSENVGLPDAFSPVRAFLDLFYQIFCLLLCADNGGDLRFDSCPYHMNGRAF